MSEVTRILAAIERGDAHAAEQLLPLVYDELRKLAAARLAAEAPGQTLQATALVHEAYLRLVDVENADRWDSRGHFFAAAAEAMRRILVDQARARGSRQARRPVRSASTSTPSTSSPRPPRTSSSLIDEALARLAAADPSAARLVKLRFFAGLSIAEAGDRASASPRQPPIDFGLSPGPGFTANCACRAGNKVEPLSCNLFALALRKTAAEFRTDYSGGLATAGGCP